MTAKICELSPVEQKFSVIYYQKMIEEMGCYNSEIYYELAHIYEKIYGNIKEAMRYYQKIHEMNGEYYRAEYKLALEKENRGELMEALLHYQHIFNITFNERSRHISAKNIEYYSKALWGIIRILNEKDVAEKLIGLFRKDIEELKKTNMTETQLEKIVYLMFAPDNRELLEVELDKEMHRKINDLCVM